MEQGHPPAGATDVPATDVPATQITLHTVAERQRRLQQLRFSAPVTVSAAGESFVVPQTALPSTRKEYDQTDVGTEHAILRNEVRTHIYVVRRIFDTSHVHSQRCSHRWPNPFFAC